MFDIIHAFPITMNKIAIELMKWQVKISFNEVSKYDDLM